MLSCARLIILMLLLAASIAPAEAATNRAMLIGVTSYPVSRDFTLEGPANDVRVMEDVLSRRGFKKENIRVFSDGFPGAKAPTRANIMAGLSALAHEAHEGDFIYIHFSGHGSQQPAKAGSDETDGRDEIFLPKDIGSWESDNSAVKNAIVDDDVREAIHAIRKKKAFVWVVFDSCHSGTMTRGVRRKDIRMRSVKPESLGIPESAFSAPHSLAFGERIGASEGSVGWRGRKTDTVTHAEEHSKNLGGLVAFYAAQSTQETPEMIIPSGGKTHYGLFTYTLAESLKSSRGITYRQLAEQIKQAYKAKEWYESTPLVEGDLDQGVFGETVGQPVRQWELEVSDSGELMIHAGSIHLLNKGAVFAVVPNPLSGMEDNLGYLIATQVNELSTSLAPYKGDKKAPGFSVKKLRKGQYARLIDPNTRYELKVYAHAQDGSVGGFGTVINRLREHGIQGVEVNWVDQPDRADLMVVAEKKRVYLLKENETPRDDNVISSGFDHTAVLEKWLKKSLLAIAKVKNIEALSSAMGSNFPGLAMHVQVRRKVDGKSREFVIDGSTMRELHDKDDVTFFVRNGTDRAMDITVLFRDSHYGLMALYPEAGQANRLVPGAKKTIYLGSINASTSVGEEGLLVIAVPAAGPEPENFSFLAQPGIVRSKGVGGSSTKAMFASAGFDAPRARGLDKGGSSVEFQVRFIRWLTVRLRNEADSSQRQGGGI